jgi:threonine dehydrogenase-like Zn-dependent dehydrogenase
VTLVYVRFWPWNLEELVDQWLQHIHYSRHGVRRAVPARGADTAGKLNNYSTGTTVTTPLNRHHTYLKAGTKCRNYEDFSYARATDLTKPPMAENRTMKAVVFNGPSSVSVVDRPIPQLHDSQDIIVQVDATALCGSELHVFRGHQPSGIGFIMGHEFVGYVTDIGTAVKTVKKGDRVVAPFTTSCGDCFYCNNGYSSRCINGKLFGSAALDGAQAEYVRVPYADGTVVKAPSEIDEKALILMADIWPTGFFGARNGFNTLRPQQPQDAVVVVIGCGPVGLCAIVSALEYRPKHLFAVDSVESRLKLAQSLGAEPLNFKSDKDGMLEKVKAVTEGRGADAVIEVVGLSPALRTAYELVRPFGVISSIGVHNAEVNNLPA